MMRKSLAAVFAALSALAAASAAHASCGDRPGTPNRVSAEPTPGQGNTIRFHWVDTTRADERVWHDIEISNAAGRVISSLTGVDHGMRRSNQDRFVDFSGMPPNSTRCFRIRARDAAGSQGCVSKIWSARVCAAATSAPATTQGGTWGALAADGHGRWGYAVNYATETQARAAARQGCGSGYYRPCTVRIAAQVSCYAYFESRSGGYWYGLALHSSGATALQVARSGCEKGAPAGTCKLVKANCGS